MPARFASNLLVVLLGGWLAVARFALPAGPTRWLTLGTGCAVTAGVALAFLFRGRGVFQRSLDVVMILTGAWTIVAAVTFFGPVGRALTLGEGCAFAGLGLLGLIWHEVLMEIAVRRPSLSAQDGHGAAPLARPEPIAARRSS